jgi:hypothetical protein
VYNHYVSKKYQNKLLTKMLKLTILKLFKSRLHASATLLSRIRQVKGRQFNKLTSITLAQTQMMTE